MERDPYVYCTDHGLQPGRSRPMCLDCNDTTVVGGRCYKSASHAVVTDTLRCGYDGAGKCECYSHRQECVPMYDVGTATPCCSCAEAIPTVTPRGCDHALCVECLTAMMAQLAPTAP